jgi:hypothetical protein
LSDEALLPLMGGNADAVALIRGFHRLCEVWDDHIDGERNEREPDVHAAFEWALFGLHSNAFWRAHQRALETAMRLSIANWKAANVLEAFKESDDRLASAWVLRCSPYDFFVAVALCAGGQPAADRAALYFRGAASADTLAGYIAEHRKD